MEITKDIKYVGVNDHDIDLFEGQYDVRENGMAYNSYVVLGERKVAVMDAVDAHFVGEWLENLETALVASFKKKPELGEKNRELLRKACGEGI